MPINVNIVEGPYSGTCEGIHKEILVTEQYKILITEDKE